MRKYVWKRIGLALGSLLVVVMAVMILVYTMIERSVIFQTDDVWNKKSLNDRIMYEYNMYQKYGYLTFEDYTTYVANKYKAIYGDDYYKQPDYLADKAIVQDADNFLDNATVKEFAAAHRAEGHTIKYYTPEKYKSGKTKPGGNGYLVAVDESNVFVRLVNYIRGFISVETRYMVDDPELTDRYVRFEKDPYSGLFAVVGSGTHHKYLLYFDSRFPFIHQNFIHINLGVSFTTYRGQEITSVVTNPTGELKTSVQQYPLLLGTDEYVETAINFHSLTYNSGEVSDVEKSQFPDKYTVYTYTRGGLSMIENSFVTGLIATIIAYMVGLPLGIYMARHKEGIIDQLGTGYIVFITAVPSLAYIFIFAAIGTSLFGLPYKFANAEVKVLAYILPTISLALPQISGLMKWMRRFMVDQMNSDYVKFARAEGLSEKEIYNIHISRNAFIPLVHSIPGNIIFCLTGAIITERVYSLPGVGNLLTTAINAHDNGVIVACTVFFTALALISEILGDVLLCKYDPRISLSMEGGGRR